jgi:hypothetical protein
MTYVLSRIGKGVRVGEAVAKVAPDVAVVGMTCQGLLIFESPGPEAGEGKLELHGGY